MIAFDNAPIEEVNCHKHRVTLSSNLSWEAHILCMFEKASKRLNLLKGMKFKLGRDTLAKLYKSLIRPIMEYANVLWDGCSANESELLEFVQYESAKVLTGAMRGTSRQKLLSELSWVELETRRSLHKLVLYYTFRCSLTQNTHSFTSIDDQYRADMFIYATVHLFARIDFQ